jgi:hypothetical protein
MCTCLTHCHSHLICIQLAHSTIPFTLSCSLLVPQCLPIHRHVMDVIYLVIFFHGVCLVAQVSDQKQYTCLQDFRPQILHSFNLPFLLNPSFSLPVANLFSLCVMAALDILHFFTGVRPAGHNVTERQEPRPLKVCKLCLYVEFL